MYARIAKTLRAVSTWSNQHEQKSGGDSVSRCPDSPLSWTPTFFNLTLILLRLFQQHYWNNYNFTGQSQESEGSYKPARIKEVHSKLYSFQVSLCALTATHLTLIYVCTYIRLSVPLGLLIKQVGVITHTILSLWETPELNPWPLAW